MFKPYIAAGNETVEVDSSRIQIVPVAWIKTAQTNARKATGFDAGSLAELGDSIREHGLESPIVLQFIGPKEFSIIAGERRYRAITTFVKEWTAAPCIVKKLTPEAARSVMLIENGQRVDINPMEESDAYAAYTRDFGASEEVLARQIGKSVKRVRDMLALQALTPDAQHMLRTGNMTVGYASALSALPADKQRRALKTLALSDGGMSLRKFKDMCSQLAAAEDGAFDFMKEWEQHAKKVAAINNDEAAVERVLDAIPTDGTLPAVPLERTWGASLRNYVEALQADVSFSRSKAGQVAINTIGNFYWLMVKNGYIPADEVVGAVEG